jgi:arylsulfatase A-like enzyme
MPKSRHDSPPLSPKGLPRPWWGEDEMKIRRWRSYYWGLVTLIDDMIGKIAEAMDHRSLRENTLIIFTSVTAICRRL